MRYAVIENEEFASTHLKGVVETLYPGYKCVFCSETVEESIAYFKSEPDVDIVFMDIELADGNCFKIFESVDMNVPVIFTTAYDEYALRAFKENSIDYLLKPITEEDVAAAINKYERVCLKSRDYREVGLSIRNRKRSRILINDGQGYSFVSTEDIAWFAAEDKYVTVTLKDGVIRLTELPSLGDVVDVLDPETFYQVSRSVVVCAGAIRKVSKYFRGRLQIELSADDTTRVETVSSARRHDFLNWLGHSGR